MRLLIDANVLLDVLQKRERYYRDSALIWKLCETEQAEGFVSSLTLANLFYVMRKELDAEKIEEIFQKLRLIFQFADLCVSDITRAVEMKWDDLEDAIQGVTAERIHADYIVTRNVRDFKKSRITAFTPTEYLAGV